MRGNCISKMIVVLENKESGESGIYCVKFSTLDVFHHLSIIPIKKTSLSSREFNELCSKVSEMVSDIHEKPEHPFGEWIDMSPWCGIGLFV